MVMDIIHKLKYVIKFKNPVDIFDVIKRIQIQLRHDFVANNQSIIVIELNSSDLLLTQTDFMKKYNNIYINKNWINLNSDLYNDISMNNTKLITYIKEEYLHLLEIKSRRTLYDYDKDKPFENFSEDEYIDFWLKYMRSFKTDINNIVLPENEQRLIDTILSDHDTKDNIEFNGWSDGWFIY